MLLTAGAVSAWTCVLALLVGSARRRRSSSDGVSACPLEHRRAKTLSSAVAKRGGNTAIRTIFEKAFH
jgi:hypothetical protein